MCVKSCLVWFKHKTVKKSLHSLDVVTVTEVKNAFNF